MYFKAVNGQTVEIDLTIADNRFSMFAKKQIALQTRPGAMRYEVSECIFSYDGTDRIRFTGHGYEAVSQPDASGPPKMDLLCDLLAL